LEEPTILLLLLLRSFKSSSCWIISYQFKKQTRLDAQYLQEAGFEKVVNINRITSIPDSDWQHIGLSVE
jgi:hypothetical protein